MKKTTQQNDEVLAFLSWIVTNDFSAGLPDLATAAEAMLQAGKSFKEIRRRADELLAKMAARAS